MVVGAIVHRPDGLDQPWRSSRGGHAPRCRIDGGVVMTWGSNSWREAAEQYHRDRAGWPLIVEIEPEKLKLLRRLMDPAFELSHVWATLNSPRTRPTPEATITAVMHAVRKRGLAALEEPATKARLAGCDAEARAEINRRIEKPEPQL